MGQDRTSVNTKKLGLNANVIKTIAILSMFIDHFSRLITEDGTPERWVLHLSGRLAAPLIAYLIAEGHHYTSDKKAYAIRLFIFALISHIPYVMYFNLGFFGATSVFWSLLLGLIALSATTSESLSDLWKVLIVMACLILAAPANWNYIGVLWILAFGIYRENFKWKMIAFAVVGLLFYAIPGLQEHGAYVTYRFGFLLAIPLFYYYNGEPGKRNVITKWAFYWFYPMHLIFLYLLRLFLT